MKKTDLPCWCGDGRTCCALYTEPVPHLHCFKCDKQNYKEEDLEEYMNLTNVNKKIEDTSKETRLSSFPKRGIIAPLEQRKLTKETCEKYGVEKLFNAEGANIGTSFPAQDEDGNFIAQKIKYNDGKQFWYGETTKAGMFGWRNFPNAGKYITITEGEEDAMSAYQMLKEQTGWETASISVKDGAGGAERDCKKHWEYINSFENIIICFDGDKPGQEAAAKVAKLFNYKPKIVHFTDSKFNDKTSKWEWKDANDYLKGNKTKEFVNLWYRAEKYTPKGVLSFRSLWDDMTKEDSDLMVPFPWSGLNEKLHGFRTGQLGIIKAPPKIGKCFGKDTPIRMWDGTCKMAQDIVQGDKLMGDDGTVRNVLSTTTGVEELFKIEQKKRDAYIVNKSHILCVKSTDTKEKIDISLENYLIKSERIRWKGYAAPILKEAPINLYELDPYILGAWLGDGTSDSPQITNTNEEVIKAIYDYAKSMGLEVSKQDPIRYWIKGSLFKKALEELNLLNNKHIPIKFLTAPMSQRLSLLAGLVDTDGHYQKSSGGGTYTITQKSPNLSYGILNLARSCGFKATCNPVKKYCISKGEKVIGDYYNINISGDLNSIPCKIEYKKAPKQNSKSRDPSVSGLTITSIGEGAYYGFVLDGNHRFLLKDCTVVHNTQILREIVYFIRTESAHNVGLIFLEDTRKSVGLGLCALHLNKPIQFPDVPTSLEELKVAHDFLSEKDRITLFDPSDDRTVENIFNKILYFVKAHDCKFIILDHISMLAYQSGDHDERRFLDKLLADLKSLTTSLNIGILAVTHVNDDGKTRGSRAPVQLCNFLINLERDKLNPDPVLANTTSVIVEENRLTGDSGLACKLFFSKETGRMTELDLDLTMEREVKFDE